MNPGDIVWVDLTPRPRKYLAMIVAPVDGTHYDVLVKGRVERLHKCWLVKTQ